MFFYNIGLIDVFSVIGFFYFPKVKNLSVRQKETGIIIKSLPTKHIQLWDLFRSPDKIQKQLKEMKCVVGMQNSLYVASHTNQITGLDKQTFSA